MIVSLREMLAEIWTKAFGRLQAKRPTAARTAWPTKTLELIDLENDPFFRLPRNSDWNACIGKQGNEFNDLDGYIEASLGTIDAVIQQKKFEKRDTVVLPILYNARHSVELLLKFVADRLFAVRAIPNLPPRNHDISEYWRVLVESNVGDEALRNQIVLLGKFVKSLARVDDDGQELRYHLNRDKVKSLEEFSLANLEVIRESLVELQGLVHDLTYRALSFVDERATGTFTPRLSRQDLFAVAAMLPPFVHWKEDEFNRAKAAIKKRFGIGSRQLSLALSVIKTNRELSAMLGRETPLAHLTDEKILWVVGEWRKAHPPRMGDDTAVDYFDQRRVGKMREGLRIMCDAVEAVTKHLSADEISELETLFYLGRDDL